MRIDGGCHCGAITYEAEIDPEIISICHCTDCQALTGTAYRVTALTGREQFTIVRGTPKAYHKTGSSGAIRLQMFCGDCGSPLYATGPGEAAARIGIRVGTINQRQQLSPKMQKWCGSALPWSLNIKDLPHAPDN